MTTQNKLNIGLTVLSGLLTIGCAILVDLNQQAQANLILVRAERDTLITDLAIKKAEINTLTTFVSMYTNKRCQ